MATEKQINWDAYKAWLVERLTEAFKAGGTLEFGVEIQMDGEDFTEVTADGVTAEVPTRFITEVEVADA